MDSLSLMVRRFLPFIFLLFLFPSLGSPAFAQTYHCKTVGAGNTCTVEQAYEECMHQATEYEAIRNDSLGGVRCLVASPQTPSHEAGSWYGEFHRNNGVWTGTGGGFFNWTSGCDAGSNWNEDLKKCFDPSECLARNGAANGIPNYPVSKPFQERCVAGCMFKRQKAPGSSCTVIHLPQGGTQTLCSDIFEYSGDTCSADPNDPDQEDNTGPEPNEDSCKETGDGMTICKKADGRECISTGSGASICWGVGETGQKSHGADAQTRGAGSDEPTPELPTPPEAFDPDKKQGPVTTDTTTQNPNGSTTTTTTTVINNTTMHGTNPPGRPGGPGSGNQGGEDGDEDGEGGVASGDCNVAPTCTLGESIGCAILQQTWANKCSALQGADSPEIGDFSSLNDLPGLDTALSEVWNQGAQNEDPPGIGDLETGWAGRGNCPIELQFSIPGFRSYTMDGLWLCFLLDALAELIKLIGVIHGGMILATGFRKGG